MKCYIGELPIVSDFSELEEDFTGEFMLKINNGCAQYIKLTNGRIVKDLG